MNSEVYCKLVDRLKEKGATWYSFENKHTRPIRVVAKGLHPSTSAELIEQELKGNGLKVKSVTGLIKIQNKIQVNEETKVEERVKEKVPLPVFQLTFEREEDVKKINEINTLASQKVKIAPVKTQPKRIAQCFRCQSFNHTKAFCYKSVKCLKCAEGHWTYLCPYGRLEKPKCANCHEEGHPANYTGCVVFQHFKEQRLKALEKKEKESKGADQALPN